MNEAVAPKPEKLMIVENESIIAKDLEYSLKRLGWHTKIIANSAPEALAMARECHPDLILMDIKLGGKEDGIDVAGEISRFSDVPVIYLTAYADSDTLNRAKKTRPYGYIIKPFDERTLQVTIEMALFKHQAEKKLREKDLWLNRVVGNLTEGLIATDSQMRIRFINPSASVFTGWSSEEALDKPLGEVLRLQSDSQGESGAIEFPEISEGEFDFPIGGRYTLTGRQGDRRLVECRSAPMEEESGASGDVLLVLDDITQRKQLEIQLQQSQKMEAIGALAAGIAHDFNNILSVILGYTEMTIRDLPAQSRERVHLEYVFTAGERARDLVKQILAFSRQSEQEKRPVQVSLIVKEALKLLRSSLPSTIEIQKFIRSEGLVLSDPTQIHQIMMNLCTNAAYAMKESGGVLEVGLEDTDINGEPFLRLRVRDTGLGMSEEVLSRIYEPFFTTKPPGEGTGMGLAVIHGIVSNMGGMISAVSAPGQGAEFNVLLPRVMETMEIIPDKRFAEKDISGDERILLVDDEPVLAELCRAQLERLGYKVAVYNDSREAVENYKQNSGQYDLVVTDLTMPHISGLKLVREIRSVRSDAPVIVITGFRSSELAKKCKALDINKLLTKPLDSHKLGSAVRIVLDASRRDNS